ncbi:uncharacterized protein AB675_7265 [Cyphellophora attinorum]|uniref:AB hydrolase-1 domain-containing protein n=1 Tax=Cyphellophora attinorum TaxID=1664694 RepID=A0A0N0NIZ7_9EURO|nr:uncharacterized protein AB675_7265 [Phialophora attinorum]KPI36328.1 hypothetical protein AB675_7265 [Phialophora attinorum]
MARVVDEVDNSTSSAASTAILIPPPQEQPLELSDINHIPAPALSSFQTHFPPSVLNFPTPTFATSALGTTAIYSLPPQAPYAGTTIPSSSINARRVLLIHGVNTPAVGSVLPLARAIQLQVPSTHIVMYDLWGHGLSSTPLVAHTPEMFGMQIESVLQHVGWCSTSTPGPAATASSPSEPNKIDIIGYSLGCTLLAQLLTTPQPTHPSLTPTAINTITLIAPSGLLPPSWFPLSLETAIQPPSPTLSPTTAQTHEARAQHAALAWLEGPNYLEEAQAADHNPTIWTTDHLAAKDWTARLAKAMKHWEVVHHTGYPASVLSIVRHAGIRDQEGAFRGVAALGRRGVPGQKGLGGRGGGGDKVRVQAILGGLDDVVSEAKMRKCGFGVADAAGNVMVPLVVVAGADHGLPRDRREWIERVAEEIVGFWGS